MAEITKRYDDLDESGMNAPFLAEVVHSQFPCTCEMCTRPIPEDKQLKNEDGSPMERKPRWHIQLRPIDFDIGGATGCFHEWIPESDRKESIMGVWLKQLDEMGINIKNHEDLKGYKLIVKRDDIEFERPNKEPFVIEDKIIPVRLPDTDQTTTAQPPDDNPPKPPTETTDNPDFTGLISILKYTGLKRSAIGKWARDHNIDPKVLDTFMKEHKDSGALKEDSEGLYTL